MRRTVRSKHTLRVLSGHEQSCYELPADILRIRDAADRVAQMPPIDAPPAEALVWEQIVDGSVSAAMNGKPLPDPSKAVEANRLADERYQRQKQQRVEVAAELEQMLATSITDMAETIVTEALQPALAEIVAQVEEAAQLLPDGELTARMILVARDEVRQAWLRAEAAAARYDAVRETYDSLNLPPGSDEHGEFRELANRQKVWPQSVHRNVTRNPAPWPADPVNRLLWLVRHGAQLVAPTSAEREAMWTARYGEAQAQREQYNRQAAEYRAAFGG